MTSLRRWFRGGRDFSVEEEEVLVTFAEGRSQRVSVTEEEETFHLRSVVATRGEAEKHHGLALFSWRRNRATQLVGFRLDQRGRLVGEGWVPKAGLTPEEFQLCVRRVAEESDRLEYLLTGRDKE